VSTDTLLGRCLVSCMHLSVGETLDAIRGLRTPVARTSHFGNNGAHNWGWLALGGNTELLQWEHSLFGVDDIYVPWMVLGNRGVVEACYGPAGLLQAEETGRHVGEALRNVEHKYQRHLNIGIYADYRGGDLMASHCRTAEELSRHLNASRTALVSAELLGMREVLTDLMRDLCRTQNLHLLFNRWVRQSRKGYLVMLKLRNIEYHGSGEVALYTKDRMQMFRGPIDSLIELFFEHMDKVSERLRSGIAPGFRAYPWIVGFSTYLLRALKEVRRDPAQTTFWHAGGSSSQFYIHEEEVCLYMAEAREAFGRLGYLPADLQIRLIPTFSSQLFATREESLAVLESLLDFWRTLLAQRRETTRHYLDLLASEPNPRPVVEEFCRTLSPGVLVDIVRRVDEFNAIDPHQLPIANVANHGHPTYNKYGIAQRELLGASLCFPPGLQTMPWVEAELLVKTIALVLIDRQG
jgi:hypothetical protein